MGDGPGLGRYRFFALFPQRDLEDLVTHQQHGLRQIEGRCLAGRGDRDEAAAVQGLLIGESCVLGAENQRDLAAAGQGVADIRRGLLRRNHSRAPTAYPGRGAVD